MRPADAHSPTVVGIEPSPTSSARLLGSMNWEAAASWMVHWRALSCRVDGGGRGAAEGG